MSGRGSAACAAATIQLYGRLWLELEKLSGPLTDSGAHGPRADAELRLEIFRLELAVLLDACGSARWRDLLGPEHGRRLQDVLLNLLAMLEVAPDKIGHEVLWQAQDTLLDAVLSEYAQEFKATDGAGPAENPWMAQRPSQLQIPCTAGAIP